MLELIDMGIRSANKDLFKPIHCRVKAGQLCALMGPSGIGKSSLLNHLAGTLSSDLVGFGCALMEGQAILDLPMEQRRLGLLEQAPLLFPHMTVLENVLFALPPQRQQNRRLQTAQDKLREVGMLTFAHHLPDQLSGGQQARVALVRTLAAQPKALLLDEAFSKLDQSLRSTMRQLVKQTIVTANIPAIIVTHDPEDAAQIADEVIILEPNE